jgi:hypothetical protein
LTVGRPYSVLPAVTAANAVGTMFVKAGTVVELT